MTDFGSMLSQIKLPAVYLEKDMILVSFYRNLLLYPQAIDIGRVTVTL